ncbi:acyltransferase domain-containing protein, partial [Streptomyces sp. SID6139]|uniref:CurL C-terminal domain-containing protein n=1 Tax=Streptomyces sp. SID6139 TaxID=2690320 RepID=UPI001F2A31FE
MGGTNCHLIVSEAPATLSPATPATPAPPAPSMCVLPLSGRSEGALRAQAGRLLRWWGARPEVSAVDVACGLVSTRSVFERRAVVVGEGRAELECGLRALAGGEESAAVVRGGVVSGVGEGVVFVFPGQGAQWVGMGAELLDAVPVFGEWIGLCEAA